MPADTLTATLTRILAHPDVSAVSMDDATDRAALAAHLAAHAGEIVGACVGLTPVNVMVLDEDEITMSRMPGTDGVIMSRRGVGVQILDDELRVTGLYLVAESDRLAAVAAGRQEGE